MCEGAAEANDGDSVQAARISLDQCIHEMLGRFWIRKRKVHQMNLTVVPIQTAWIAEVVCACANTEWMAFWMPRVTSGVVGCFAEART